MFSRWYGFTEVFLKIDMIPKLTIITDPIPLGLQGFYEYCRRYARWLYRLLFVKMHISILKYGGHTAVTRSVVEGLTKLEANFNYNPTSLSKVGDSVHVLAGARTLRQMIELKRKGRIKKLTAGPNIVVFSTEFNSILASPEIDGLVNHCDWACESWAVDYPNLLNKCFCWPAGVDTVFWSPSQSVQRSTILIFDKRRIEESPDRTWPYIAFLREQGWQTEVITRITGDGKISYTAEYYRSLLQRSALMIGFTVGSESQGIAWAEAWACDVPTLILRNTVNTYQGRTYNCSTAPFLTDATGLFFDNLNHFKTQFGFWQAHREKFTPLAWVLRNMSDEVSARLLYGHITGDKI